MTWQRATEIVAGRLYSWDEAGRHPWVARMVDREGDEWAFSYRCAAVDKVLCASSVTPTRMPYEQAPVPPWIVRTEYRVPKGGERYIASWGRVNIAGEDWLDDEGPRVVLIIEPNPDYQAGVPHE